MIYIVVALKGEAQAFVDKYKLSKKSVLGFTLFQNDKMSLIIGGMGVQNARAATQTLINLYDITDEDIYLNVGICAASREYEIGELLRINAVSYQEQFYKLIHKEGATLTCVDEQLAHQVHEIADMESFGFYDAVIHSPAIKNFFIFKVVSDHFEPQKVTKDGAKMLIFKHLDAINAAINS
jgi:purine-nucleoside phosphorylase